MSILTKPSNPISANTDIQFELNLSELLTLVESITESSYWEDSSNWRAVDFIFTNSQKQYQRVVFKVNQNETSVTYRFSEDCINGLFECSRITVFGNVNDSLRIKRSSYGSQFDVIIEDGVEEVLAIDLTSMNVPTNDTYSDGDILDFTLNFSGLVNVEGLQILTENSEPILLEDGFSIVVEESRLVLTIGSNTRYANYYSGSSTSSVTYRYIVQADDQDLDGLEIVGLDLNGGDIVGVNGENVNLVLPNVDTSGIIINNVVIDTEQPTILSIDVLDGTYTNTDEIVFTLTFSEQISILGSPELLLDVGGVSKVASLVSSSSTQAVFSYIVGSTDNDADGISIISLDNGVIQDAALNLLDRTLPTVDTSNVLVFNNVIAPTIVSITVNPGTYILGDTLSFVVKFSENVIISNGDELEVSIGGVTVRATLVSYIFAISTASYSYNLPPGLLDTDGIEVLSFTYPPGTVYGWYSGTPLDSTLPVIDTSNVFVDTVAPTITSVTPPVDGTYSEGQQLNFTVNFDDTVLVTGAPFLELTIGSTVKQAEYVSGTGSSSLLFRYTVASGDEDTNGITFTSNSVKIPASTIRDVAGNNAVLTFTSPSMTGIIVQDLSFESSNVNNIPGIINQFKYEPMTNILYMSKAIIGGYQNSSGLLKSLDDGNVFNQVTLTGGVYMLETSSIGNVYAQLATSTGNVIYQSLDQGGSYTSANIFLPETLYDPNTDRFYWINLLSGGSHEGYIRSGPDYINAAGSQRLLFANLHMQFSVESREVEGDYVFIGFYNPDNNYILGRTKISDWIYNANAFGGPTWTAGLDFLTIPVPTLANTTYSVRRTACKDNHVYALVQGYNSNTLTHNYSLFYSSNYGDSFSNVILPSPQAISDIHIGNNVYVVFGNDTQGSVYKSPIGSLSLSSNLNFPEIPGRVTSGNGFVYVSNYHGTVIYKIEDI
jgi:hypothetical protein